MTRLILFMSSLFAASLAHAVEPLPPVEEEALVPPEVLYPVDFAGGPRGALVPTPLAAPLMGLTTAPLPSWTKAHGTAGTEQATATATCGGFLYTVGTANRALPGGSNAGGMDVFLLKHKTSNGQLIWTEQFGSVSEDYATGIAIQGCASGNPSLYVTGYTKGTLPGGALHGGTNQGGHDVFVRKYNANKVLQWSRQRGSSQDDLSYGIAVNETTGDVYVTGYTLGSFVPGVTASGTDIIVARYLANGAASTALQVGTTANRTDIARSLTVDRAGNVYVAGYTNGTLPGQAPLGGTDFFLMKYSADLGTREWVRQEGTSGADYGYAVTASRNATGATEIYLVGHTLGATLAPGTLGTGPLTNAGDYDAVIFQYSPAGEKQRTALLGSPGRESVTAIASDGGANLYVVGTTTYDLKNVPGSLLGNVDIFLAKYDARLELKSLHQYGSTHTNPALKDETATGVSADTDNGVYVVGFSKGHFGTGTNQGDADLFVMRYADGCSVDPVLVASCRGATGWGDPHLVTADRFNYDFQSVGEFILTESVPRAADPFVVQARQKASGTRVALYSGIAARFGTDRVGVYARAANPLMVNGAAVALPVGDARPLSDGTRVFRPTATRYVVTSPQGDQLVVDHFTTYLNVALTLVPSRAGQVRGLLGNYNNIRADDFALRDGTQLTAPLSFNQLYKNTPNFADSWRISQAESLFDYGSGESTASLTHLNLPLATTTLKALSPVQQAAAERTCQEAGVTDPAQLEGCIMDVTLTGDSALATGAAEAQALQPIANEVYLGRFDTQVGTEWSHQSTQPSPSGDRRFLGEFGNESVQLSLASLPAHGTVTVSLDLLILQGWEGHGASTPHAWGVRAERVGEVFRTTFSNTDSPQDYPSQAGGTAHPAGTGAMERYPNGDSIYRVSFTFEHTAPELTLQLFADGLPGLPQAAWGLDHVRVQVR
ncbi:SBBP repeat-containing protein [Myxococcus sp. K38C18041901]|uniref:SBBP repeat-containing protein n=1 Tax=Myxococcus guangdongensis TaxID=2906760 RepID=UPI0020A7FE01|nr:SBBP repeat-containing protein [Myxococcus guangdongensis]MCP3065842.1 SBBP repeat-containing protein [Myxococcus guangdongensis]